MSQLARTYAGWWSNSRHTCKWSSPICRALSAIQAYISRPHDPQNTRTSMITGFQQTARMGELPTFSNLLFACHLNPLMLTS